MHSQTLIALMLCLQLNPTHSVGMYIDAVQLAVKKRDEACLRMLMTELRKPSSEAKERAEVTRSMISASGTGRCGLSGLAKKLTKPNVLS